MSKATKIISKGAKKFDQNKMRLDLVPTTAIEDIANVLTFGANKYGDRNWEKGMKWSRVIASHDRQAGKRKV